MIRFSLFTGALLVLAGSAMATVLVGNYPQTNDSSQLAGATPIRFKAFKFTMPAQDYALTNVRVRAEFTAAGLAGGNFPVIRIHGPGATADVPGPVLSTLNLESPSFVTGIIDYTFVPPSAFTLGSGQDYWLTLAGTNTTSSLNFRASVPAVPYTGLTTVSQNRFTTNGTSFSSSTIFQTWEINVANAPSQQLSGTVVLEDFTPAEQGRLVKVEVLDSSSTVVFTANNVALGAGGTFSVSTNLTAGTYSVLVKSSHWLRRAVANVNVTASGASGLNFSLKNGDVNDDNEVGPGDFSLLASAFGSFLGDPGYTDATDLNGDEEVGPADFSILAASFGEFGD